jgi:hypothetical protein
MRAGQRAPSPAARRSGKGAPSPARAGARKGERAAQSSRSGPRGPARCQAAAVHRGRQRGGSIARGSEGASRIGSSASPGEEGVGEPRNGAPLLARPGSTRAGPVKTRASPVKGPYCLSPMALETPAAAAARRRGGGRPPGVCGGQGRGGRGSSRSGEPARGQRTRRRTARGDKMNAAFVWGCRRAQRAQWERLCVLLSRAFSVIVRPSCWGEGRACGRRVPPGPRRGAAGRRVRA